MRLRLGASGAEKWCALGAIGRFWAAPRIAKALPESAVFVKELIEFRASWSESGNLTFNARSGCHDDLVLAAALAVWGANRPKLVMDLRIGFAI